MQFLNLQSQVLKAHLLWLKDRGFASIYPKVTSTDPKPIASPKASYFSTGHALNELRHQVLSCQKCSRGQKCIARFLPHDLSPNSMTESFSGNCINTNSPQVLVLSPTLISEEISPAEYQLLEKMLLSINLQKVDYRILPLVFCDSAQKNFGLEEVDACRSHLEDLIAFYKPRLILTLGHLPTLFWISRDYKALKKGAPDFQSLRGRFFRSPYLSQKLGNAAPPIIGTFAPIDLLRFAENKRLAWEDLKRARRYLDVQNN